MTLPIQTINISTKVFFGFDAIEHLVLPCLPVLLVTSRSVPRNDLKRLSDIIRKQVSFIEILVKPPGEPTSSMIDKAFSGLPRFDAVVAIGGGSTLDFAKGLALLGGNGGRITDYEFSSESISLVLPMFFVPTTCGTGSEVTPYAVINNSDTCRKFTLHHLDLRSAQAAIDPSVLISVPDEIILSSALDAFSHCLEAVLSCADTQLIWPIATQGLQIAWNRLHPEVRSIGGSSYFSDLARLSLFGGISIAHSRTGLIHTLSVAFAQFCKTPHGMLNARLLPFAIRHSLQSYDGLLRRVVEAACGQSLNSDQEAFDLLVSWLHGIIGTDFPLPPAQVARNKEALIARLIQDKGLPLVCHGDVSETGLNRLIEEMIHA